MTRLELMRALGRGDALRDALIAEALGMSPEEFAMVAQRADRARGGTSDSPAAEDGGVPFVEALEARPGVARRHRASPSRA